jgi:hypothetical protein
VSFAEEESNEDDEGELGDFGGLELDAEEVKPSRGVVDVGTEEEGYGEEDDGDGEEDGESGEEAVRDVVKDEDGGEAGKRE